MRVTIGFLVRSRVRIKIRIRVRGRVVVTFNVRVYHWSNCRRSKCRTFKDIHVAMYFSMSSCNNAHVLSIAIGVLYDSRNVYTWVNTILLWQKEASDKNDISCQRAEYVCHFH